MQLSFSHRKAIQALNFFARSANGRINKMKALKLIYFADRYHLRKFGRPVTNDSYFAMPYGPVASQCLNLLNEKKEFTAPAENKYRNRFLKRQDNLEFSSKAEVEETVLSQTDLEALGYAWKVYSDKNEFQLAEETHRFPEWLKHKAALDSGQTRRVMAYQDFLLDPPEGVEELEPLDEETRADLLDELQSIHAVESLWS